jgi:hypothetical protein
MVNIILLTVLLTTTVNASSGYALELRLKVARVPNGVRLIASAVNDSETHQKFCGRWRYQSRYIPSPESAARIARNDSIAANNSEYTRWEGIRGPSFQIQVDGLPWNGQSISLAPSESFSDTMTVGLGPDYYKDWPGTIEVRYELEQCENLDVPNEQIHSKANAGVLMTQFAVPLGGV